MDLLIITALSCINFFIVYRFIAPLYGLTDDWRQVAVYANDRAAFALIFGAGTASVLMMSFPRLDLTFVVLGAGLVIDLALYLLARIFKFQL